MNVLFIHHSCFVVELDTKVLVFDYFNGDRVNGYHFGGKLPIYDADTPMYFFASHKHQDHFDMDIYRFAERYENIHYIISKDAKLSPNFLQKHGIDPSIREKITYVTHGEDYLIDDVKVHTYLSTDAGVAFAVEADGRHIYHAGDLNHWYWDGEDPQWNKNMTKAYQEEIAKMHGRKADIAFLPLDPRLGEYFYLGIDDFVKEVDAKHIFPMHFWGEYDVADRLKKMPCSVGYRDRIVEIHEEGESWEI